MRRCIHDVKCSHRDHNSCSFTRTLLRGQAYALSGPSHTSGCPKGIQLLKTHFFKKKDQQVTANVIKQLVQLFVLNFSLTLDYSVKAVKLHAHTWEPPHTQPHTKRMAAIPDTIPVPYRASLESNYPGSSCLLAGIKSTSSLNEDIYTHTCAHTHALK